MRKSTLFISAALTTFMLAIMFGVASAYQNSVKSTETAAVQPQPTAVAQMVSEQNAVVPPTQIVNLAPEAAAAIAGKVLGRTDLYSAEHTQFEGVDAYLITFSSGDLVYLSMDGQVLSISKLAVTTIVRKQGSKRGAGDNQKSSPVASGGSTTSTSSGSAGGGEHEGGDD